MEDEVQEYKRKVNALNRKLMHRQDNLAKLGDIICNKLPFTNVPTEHRLCAKRRLITCHISSGINLIAGDDTNYFVYVWHLTKTLERQH